MVKISFQKILKKKEVISVIEELALAYATPIVIQDVAGKVLVGEPQHNSNTKYPVKLADETIGWVIGSEIASGIASLLSFIVNQELEKKTIAAELLDKYRETTLLYNISQKMTASLDLNEVASLVIDEVKRLITATSGAVMLLNETTGKLEVIAEFGGLNYSSLNLEIGKGIIGDIISTGKGEIVNDILLDPRKIDKKSVIRSLVCVPLTAKDKVIGAIEIASNELVNYTAEDLKLLTLVASQATSAIEIAVVHRKQLSEKMSSLAQLVAGIAHEINNPVSFIGGNLTHADKYTQDILQLLKLYQQHYPQPVEEIQDFRADIDLDFLVKDLDKLLESMKAGVQRIRQIVLSLRNFSRLDEAENKPVDIHEGIDGTLMILEHRLQSTLERPAIKVVKNYSNLPLVECYAGQLNQAFMNILANAIDALEIYPNNSATNYCRLAPTIDIQTFLKDKNTVVIRIRDNGMGMTEEVKKKLFDPFFTTKPVGKGTGLGLSIGYSIVVEKHGGLLKCFSQPDEGTEFWIEIPVKPEFSSLVDRGAKATNKIYSK